MYRNTLVHRRRRTRLAVLAKLTGSLAICFLMGAVLLRLMSYATPAELVMMFAATAVLGLIAGGLAFLALVRIWFRGFDGIGRAMTALAYAIIALSPALVASVGALLTPFRNDVSTLSAQPPALYLTNESISERAGVLGSPLGQSQIVENLFPIQSGTQPAQIVEAVRKLSADEGWRLVRTSGVLPDLPYRLHYVDQTFILGFRDDVVVELRRSRTGGVEVHMRSASRIGQSDYGTNEARIRKFLNRLTLTLNAEGSAVRQRDVFQVR